MLRNAKGFTLIEIISVMVILGIVAAVALPYLSTSGIDVGTAAATIETDLRFTQELALARNQQNAGDIGIVFTAGASSYSLTDPAGVFSFTRQLPANVSIVSTQTINFNRFGEPEIAGATASLQINAGGILRTITVQQYTGRVTVS